MHEDQSGVHALLCAPDGATIRKRHGACVGQGNFAATADHRRTSRTVTVGHTRKMVFVNSMSDLLHDDVPRSSYSRCASHGQWADWHTFQSSNQAGRAIAALRSPRISGPWIIDHVWMGVSVENQDYTYRIEHLRKVPASVRFLSVEPLLGPIPRLPLQGIHWVIAGGESGPELRIWTRDGCGKLGTDALLEAFHFSLSSGVEREKSKLVANWTEEHGTRCRS